MDVTELALTWVGAPTESEVDPCFELATNFQSVSPGL